MQKKTTLMLGMMLVLVIPVLAHNANKNRDSADNLVIPANTVNAVEAQPAASAEAVASQQPATVPEAWTEKENVQTDGVELNNWRGNVSGQHRELQRQY